MLHSRAMPTAEARYTPEEFDRLIKERGLIPLEEIGPEERERWVEQQIEEMKKQHEGYGPPLFEEDLEASVFVQTRASMATVNRNRCLW